MADNAIFKPTLIAGEHISTANIVDGSFLVSPDQQKCFVDYAGERIEISDIITIATTALFQAITTPIFGKFYYITETEQLYLSTATKWVLLTPEKFPMLFAIPAKIDGDPALHFALEVHDTADYSGTALLSIDTDIDQTGVTIFDGYEWVTFPSTGAGSFYYGNQIEVAPHSSMQSGKRYVRYKLYLAGDDPVAEPWKHTIYPMTAGPQGNRGEDGTNFQPSTSGPLAGLADYDDEAKGFSYLDTDNGEVYFKNSAATGDWSDPIPFQGGKGEDGTSSYTYIAYASDNTGTDFSLTPSSLLPYRAEIVSDTEIITPILSDFAGATWVKYIGEDGDDGSVWYSGSSAPTTDLGKVGDFYLISGYYDNYVYQKTENNDWIPITNIKGRSGFVYKGVYNDSTTYSMDNTVHYNGVVWIYINPTPSAGNTPPEAPQAATEHWAYFLKNGEKGDTGAVSAVVSATEPPNPTEGLLWIMEE